MARSSVEIPQKLFFRIGEVSRLVELPSHVIRFWETQFPVLRPKKSSARHRLYRRQDVETILTIKRLLHEEKYTIAGAKRRLEEIREEEAGLLLEVAPPTPATRRRGLALVSANANREPLEVIREEIESLLRFLDEDEEQAGGAGGRRGGSEP